MKSLSQIPVVNEPAFSPAIEPANACPGNRRVGAVDQLRGIAILLGSIVTILLLNHGLKYPSQKNGVLHVHGPNYFIVKVFISEVCLPLFAFVFGASLALQQNSTAAVTNTSSPFFKRFIFISLLGCFPLLFLHNPGILLLYGQVSIVLSLLVNRSAFFLFLLAVLLCIVIVPVIHHSYSQALPRSEIHPSVTAFSLPFSHPLYTLEYCIIGMFLVKSEWFQFVRPSRLIKSIAGTLLVAGLVLKLLPYVAEDLYSFEFILMQHLGQVLFLLGLIGVVSILSAGKAAGQKNILETVGRMPLTCYVLQVLLAGYLFKTRLFETATGLRGPVAGVLIGVLFFMLQTGFCFLWQTVTDKGPVEKLLQAILHPDRKTGLGWKRSWENGK